MKKENLTYCIKKYLHYSDKLRLGYSSSLGEPVKDLNLIIGSYNKSKLINCLYSLVSGTKIPVSNEAMMDFIPGYRLIHVSELMDSLKVIEKHLSYASLIETKNLVFPFLVNYSSDFICVSFGDGEESIIELLHDVDECTIKHLSSDNFINTINKFYEEKVYYLDHDGYLDYDFDLEGKIGAELNPNVLYWTD